MRERITALVLGLMFLAVGCSERKPDVGQTSEELERRRQRILEQEAKKSPEADARKARSMTVIKAEGVPFIENLPTIATVAESKRRTTEEVAVRAMSLCVIAAKGEGLKQADVEKLIQDFKLADALTPNEKEFIRNPKPSDHDRAQFTWRYEAYWVLLWSLGFIDKLERPEKICDVGRAVAFLTNNGRDSFLRKAKLRPQAEILDAADLIYRYAWATDDARLNKKEFPARLNNDIVVERHHALNWLIGYMEQEWDDISTDT